MQLGKSCRNPFKKSDAKLYFKDLPNSPLLPLNTRPHRKCAVSSVVEHHTDTVGVAGSNPASRTIFHLHLLSWQSMIDLQFAMRTIILFFCIGFLSSSTIRTLNAAESRDEKVRSDKSNVESSGLWIYNNLDHAILEAKRTNKPLLVTFRCIP